ncbi:MAG: secretin N-terminal domain-containing protein [Ramlibacter sp.]
MTQFSSDNACSADGRGVLSGWRWLISLSTVLVASCAMFRPLDGGLTIPEPMLKPTRPSELLAAPVTTGSSGESPAPLGTQFLQTPPVPARTRATSGGVPASPPPNATSDMLESAVTLENMPLPLFANAVYGSILKRNVSIDAAVQSRNDLVSLKTGKPVTGAQLAAAAQAVLRSYGVVAQEFDGLVRVVPENSPGSGAVDLRRGRAQPDVPASLRPVFFLVELENTNVSNVTTWIRTFFQGRVTVTDDQPRNAVLLSGQSDSVSAAAEAIQILDQPALRGKYSARINPAFWSATELSSKLVEVLTAQGYYSAASGNQTAPILVIPVAPVNSIIVFAASVETLNHALRWARELDQAPPNRGGKFVTYYVRNTDAAAVAATLQDVLGGGSSVAVAAPTAPGSPAAPAAVRSTGATLSGGGKVVVNAAANSIIIQSTPAEYQQIYSLLQELDRPPRSALIMATVAEVTLSDTEQFGFNWLLKQFTSRGYVVNGSVGPIPTGSTAAANGGLALSIATAAGDPRALLTALASSNRVRVLSNPSIVALNGQEATIQVGQDVPVLTSQISNSNTGGTNGSQGVLQTVQYRSVGIILRVKPIIHAGGRVELDLNQEVSGVSSNNSGIGNSPVVTTRKVQTRLAAQDGATMLIGGLISEQRDGGNAGIPFLKDVPVAGALFRTSANENFSRTELVILLTPYIIEDDFDSRAITSAFRSQFGWAASSGLSPSTGGAGGTVSTGGSSSSVTTVIPQKVDPAEALPEAKSATPSNVKAKPYSVPDKPSEPKNEPIRREEASPRPAQPTATPSPAGQAPAVMPPGGKPGPSVPAAPGTRTVTDDKLRQELLDAIKGGK